MKQTKRRLTAVLLCGLLVLSGCGAQNTAQDTSNTGTVFSEDMTATTVSTIDTAEIFSDRDLAGTYHQRWLGDQPRPDERRPRRNGQPSRYRWPRWCAWSR